MAVMPPRRRPQSHGLEPLERTSAKPSSRFRLLTARVDELEAELAVVQQQTLEVQEATARTRQQEMSAIEGTMVYEKAMGSAVGELLCLDDERSHMLELRASAEEAVRQAAAAVPAAVPAAAAAAPGASDEPPAANAELAAKAATAAAETAEALETKAEATAEAETEAEGAEGEECWVVGPNGVRAPVQQVMLGPSRCLLTLGLEGDERGLTPLTTLLVMAERLTAHHEVLCESTPPLAARLEAQQAQLRFLELDTDRDGLLSVHDVLPALGLPPLLLRRAFEGVVTPLASGRRGAMGPSDFAQLLGWSGELGGTRRSLRCWFRALDLDEDGVLSVPDLREWWRQMARPAAASPPERRPR